MVCAAKNFSPWKEDSGGNFGTDQRWICSEVNTKSISSCLKLMIRWPANTWGNVNAPPPAHRQPLNRLLKNWRRNGTVHCAALHCTAQCAGSEEKKTLCYGGRWPSDESSHGWSSRSSTWRRECKIHLREGYCENLLLQNVLYCGLLNKWCEDLSESLAILSGRGLYSSLFREKPP